MTEFQESVLNLSARDVADAEEAKLAETVKLNEDIWIQNPMEFGVSIKERSQK